MSFQRPASTGYRGGPGAGPPAWLVFLLGVALVFGMYYLWDGVQDFIATGGSGVDPPTPIPSSTPYVFRGAGAPNAATGGSNALAEAEAAGIVTPRPTFTPIPDCTDFYVVVERANVRVSASETALILDVFSQGTTVCVLGRAVTDSEWYLIDLNPATRRINEAYMFEDVVEPANPTPTPAPSNTPAPTVTPAPTRTPSITPTPAPTATPDPDITDTATPTPTPTPTLAYQSA